MCNARDGRGGRCACRLRPAQHLCSSSWLGYSCSNTPKQARIECEELVREHGLLDDNGASDGAVCQEQLFFVGDYWDSPRRRAISSMWFIGAM